MTERVIGYWNKLPSCVRTVSSVDSFKIALENFKNENMSVYVEYGHFWEISMEVLNRIEPEGYAERKLVHNKFLLENPDVAKRKGINIY